MGEGAGRVHVAVEDHAAGAAVGALGEGQCGFHRTTGRAGLRRRVGAVGDEAATPGSRWLHRYRSAMVRPGRGRLSGTVEADETFLAGPEPGVPARARRAGLGGAHRRLPELPVCLWEEDYVHRPTGICGSGHQAHELLPGVHRVASLAQRWIEATHQAAVKPALVQSYLDEFCFRFNRRNSRARGMLFYRLPEQAVQSAPRTYRCLVAEPSTARRTMPVPPLNKRVHCDSVARPALDRPWRTPQDDEHPLNSDGRPSSWIVVGARPSRGRAPQSPDAVTRAAARSMGQRRR